MCSKNKETKKYEKKKCDLFFREIIILTQTNTRHDRILLL